MRVIHGRFPRFPKAVMQQDLLQIGRRRNISPRRMRHHHTVLHQTGIESLAIHHSRMQSRTLLIHCNPAIRPRAHYVLNPPIRFYDTRNAALNQLLHERSVGIRPPRRARMRK